MIRVTLIFFFCWMALGCVSASKHETLKEQHKEASQTIEDLEEQLEKKESKIANLETVIANLEKRLGAASKDKESLKTSIQQMKKALNQASERKKQAEERLKDYKDLLAKFQKLIDSGDLSVKIVDGRMVVALPSDVLFDSGSAELSAEGEGAVERVAELLASFPNKDYQVEGHTDNVPISTANFPSNWELSAARAIHVVKTMVDAGLAKDRVSAAAFADTRPTATNETKEGRKANRRIEIVIVPDLSKLPGYEELREFTEDSNQDDLNP